MSTVVETAKTPGMPRTEVPSSTIDTNKMNKPIESTESLLKFIQERSFIFWYRSRYRPASAHILCENLDRAREKAEIYCERFGLRFISVHPMYLDLDKRKEESQGVE